MASGDSSLHSDAAKLCSSTAALQIDEAKEKNHTSRVVTAVVDSIKKQLVSDRYAYIKEKMEENKHNLTAMTQNIYNLTKARSSSTICTDPYNEDLLSKRLDDALCTVNSLELSAGEKDSGSCQEDGSYASSTNFIGSNFGVKNEVCPIRIPEVQKLSPYTTWIFLDRNQRMAEDQSIVGRRRIYYDQSCGEALLCSDSEEDVVEDEEEKKEFGSAEDYIIRMTIQQVGLSDAVLDSLAKCLKKDFDDVKARYEIFQKSDKQEISATVGESEVNIKAEDALVEKDLDAALDSFDNLFCRRCLVFDCRLHGCSQELVFPAEKQLPWFNSDDAVPCGSQCYRLGLKPESVATTSSEIPHEVEGQTQSFGHDEQTVARKKKQSSVRMKTRSHQSESASSNAKVVSESSESDLRTNQESTSESTSPVKSKGGGKVGVQKKNSKRNAERVLVCMGKKQKNMVHLNSESDVNGCAPPRELNLRSHACNSNKNSSAASTSKGSNPTGSKKLGKGPSKEASENSSSNEVQNEYTSKMVKEMQVTSEDQATIKDENAIENICKVENNGQSWKTFEQSLFMKGLEIFGRNSCLIARNLLSGMKTCFEVFQYMNYVLDNGSSGAAGVNSITEGHGNFQSNGALGNKLLARSRFFRRRGRVRRLKYTWKSAGYPSIRKRTSESKDQPCRQYNPCGCQTACGKQCPCLLNGTCCEKYCGCPKMCKNRFRGCHCAKSQCRSRQCPCFAAGRECDPDVCRNCWVGCGDGTLGVPNQRGDNYECRNMKLLLRQQQRVLLGRSDVSGWGAFLKNSVGKNEYLGEYTGELISHREADKRGKIYDRENSSFLFNLNDQFVLDAYRKGDKLKFANHSHDPNCYAKVIMVAGDHRVGIFAKDRINAGEEIFYDYLYDPNHAPAWARKSDASGLKKDEHPSIGRPRKLA